jgi:predicted membrane-bound spermidine synthase
MPPWRFASLNIRWYFAFFFISGFCSLVYEVVWLRLSMADFGVTTAMVSIVLATFMAGLGLGSWCAGFLVCRLRRGVAASALRLYALAELLVGISALLVPHLLRWGHTLLLKMGRGVAWQSSAYYLAAGVWVVLTLLPWCACMGTTFPLLMAVIRQTAVAKSERSFSYLYVANVLGALLGTTVSAFFLIELLGFRGTSHITSAFNGILVASALLLSLGPLPSRALTALVADRKGRTRFYGLPESSVLWMLFTTGLVSMGMEVVWVRQFAPYLGNVVYAFAGILSVYLLATFWGSRDYRTWIRTHQLGESAWAWTLVGLFALIPLAAADPLLRLRIGSVELTGARLSAIVPFCGLVGFLTPMLVDSWSSGDPARAGKAYAVNVLGSILGPLLAGFCLLPWLGERWALVALSLPLFVLAALTALRQPHAEVAQHGLHLNPKVRYGLAVLAAILLTFMSHAYEGAFPDGEIRRDFTATVIATGSGLEKRLMVNGTGMTTLTPITKLMAHLPLASMRRPPRNGLVVCFGMGTTFRSMLSWGIRTTAVDLVPSVPALFGFFHSDARQLLASPLAQIVVDDGRRFLDGSNLRYDVITVDPPPPPAAPGSSLLYSREFYGIVRKRLETDGVLQVWYPRSLGDAATSASVTKALKQSFSYVRAFKSFDAYGIHFLASMEPLPFASGSALARRLPPAAAADLVEWGPSATAEGQFNQVLAGQLSLEEIIAADPAVPALEDDQPINEYYLLRGWFHYYR